MGESRDVLVSGWRFILHSYAVTAQFLCLELLRRAPRLRLYFKDLPFHDPSWRASTGLFGAAAESALRAIPPPAPGRRPDAELRIAFPYDLSSPSRAARTLVFGTAEFLDVPPGYISEGKPVAVAQRESGYTLVAPSNWSKMGFTRRGVEDASVAVVPLGFDPEVFRPAARAQREQARREFEFGPDEFIFLHAGAMTPNKGLRFLFPAFAQLLLGRPRARLVLKGADALFQSKSYMESQLAELDPGQARLILGRLTYLDRAFTFEDMARLYQAADCYVSPYVAEGFNMPVLEAAACGIPVICTAGGPTDDFVTDAFALRIAATLTALDVPGQDAAMGLVPDLPKLVQAMLRIMDDADFRAAAREAGPAWVLERFTWARVVDRLLPILLPD